MLKGILMEIKVKIEKTKTMANTWTNTKTGTKTRVPENVIECRRMLAYTLTASYLATLPGLTVKYIIPG